MMKRGSFRRKCRVALIAIAGRYSKGTGKKIAPAAQAPEPEEGRIDTYAAFTLDVIDAITIDAILNWSARLTMPWRAAIQAKSV
jgi:hypothetical protein